MGATDDQGVNKFDDDFSRQVKEFTLKKYGNFLHDYSLLLNENVSETKDHSTVWDIFRNPIALQVKLDESVSFDQLVDVENVTFKKVMITFATLCDEMHFLQKEAISKFYSPLVFYGEGTDASIKEGNAYLQMGRILPLLKEVHQFVQRCMSVVKNCIQQMAVFCVNDKNLWKQLNMNGAKLSVVFEHLHHLFQVIASLDHIVENQTILREHWKLYKRMMKSVRLNPQTFGTTAEAVELFDKLCRDLEGCVLQSTMFQTCIKQSFDDPANGITLSAKNSELSEDWISYVRDYWTQLEPKLEESIESAEREDVLGLMCLYITHCSLFHDVDKKMFKLLWESHKKIPCVVIAGSSALFPSLFLLEKLPQMKSVINKNAVQLVHSNRLTWLQKFAQTLPSHEQAMESSIRSWIMKLENYFSQKLVVDFNDELNEKCKLFLQGLSYASYLRCTTSTMFAVHVSLQKPMSKSTLLSLCRLIELLKMLLSSFYRWSVMISDTLLDVVQYLTMLSVSTINAVQKRVKSEKRTSKDVFTALSLMERCFSGPSTRTRVTLVKLALGVCQKQKVLKDDDSHFLKQCLSDMETISDFKSRLHSATNCSFMYWHKVMFPIYLSGVAESPSECYRLPFFLYALEDCKYSIESVRHLKSSDLLLGDFQSTIIKQLQENFLNVICREIETDLRLNTHTHLQLDSQNPFKVTSKLLIPFIKIPSFRIFDYSINMKAYVEHYLNKTFYNLTTVALHDWRTYSEMKICAHQKFGLNLIEPHLPSQTLEQGLDILEIMRNIHIFVAKYLYNLNNQIFVEKSSSNKHLNTINIKHTANSIRTHGTGIMNTAVNFTYQFLTKKFFVFSQFLYDEHIKSRLMKDLRFFRENHLKSNQKYPFERAEKFNRGIKKLGLTSDGLSYLDQFRLLISEIGNAMGYVRLVRSGGLHCCGNAIRFVPDIDDVVNFEELCKEDALSEECINTARHFDNVISNMSKHFAGGTEYFKILVDVFSPEFQNPKNIHLKNFFMILPPLTLNFVEHMISSKEKLNKKNKIGAAFTDDGFAMGLAYILKLLEQYNEFDSLHWFPSVREKYQKEKQDILKQPQSTKTDEKLQQTMTLTIKRLENYQQEFDLLYYSLSSARIFFRADNSLDEKDEKSSATESVKEDHAALPA